MRKIKAKKTVKEVFSIVPVLCVLSALFVSGAFFYQKVSAQAEKSYVGWTQCVTCHEGVDAKFSKTRHKALFSDETAGAKSGCESCHGPGSAHLDNPGEEIVKFKDAPAKEANKACLTCHSAKQAKGWNASKHNKNGLSCVSCHNPHNATEKLLKESKVKTCTNCHVEKKGQASMPSRHPVKEGKVACTDCHNPHGNTKTAASEAKGVCVKCHAEKRGPFAFEHRPATEDCLSCHNPHGTVNQSLLVLKQPVLCLQCHGPQDVGAVVSFHDLSQTIYKKCTGCHEDIHGSNTSDKYLKQ